jgi:hypothetical protein
MGHADFSSSSRAGWKDETHGCTSLGIILCGKPPAIRFDRCSSEGLPVNAMHSSSIQYGKAGTKGKLGMFARGRTVTSRRPILPQWIALTADQSTDRIAPQLVVIIEVFIAKYQSINPLTHQLLDTVFYIERRATTSPRRPCFRIRFALSRKEKLHLEA